MTNITISIFGNKIFSEILNEIKLFSKYKVKYYDDISLFIKDAENNNQFDIDNLYVKEAYVGKSIVLKRFRARAKGRASGIKKPYSNLTIILSEKINKEEKHGSKG